MVSGSKLMGYKKRGKGRSVELVAWITVMWVQDHRKDGTGGRVR